MHRKYLSAHPCDTTEILYFRDKQATTLHCSNIPIGIQEWPDEKAVAFGNSPPETPMGKVIGGKLKFQEILESQGPKSDMVENLMNMLHCRDKYEFFSSTIIAKKVEYKVIYFKDIGQMKSLVEEHRNGANT